MATPERVIKEQSKIYFANLKLFNTTFVQHVKGFFKTESKKCLVIETKDTRTATLRIIKILKQLDSSLSMKYGEVEECMFLKWEDLLNVIGSSKLLPKFGNLLVLEFSQSEPEYNNTAILETIMERINLVPAKKAIFIFAHQDCLHTYLNEINVEAFMKIDEFQNTVTSLTHTELTVLLYQAALSGCVNHIAGLLKYGANINIPDHDSGNTALHAAAEYGDKNMVSILLRNKALIIPNKTDDTPLHTAAKFGHNDVIIALLEFDNCHDEESDIIQSIVNVNSTNIDGRTALHLAADFGRYLVVQTLLDYGANVNCKDNNGCTALHFAVFFHAPDIVKILVERGVCIDTKNKWGETALSIAHQNCYNDILEFLTPPLRARLAVNLGMI